MAFPTLTRNEVHVWRCDLATLSPDDYKELLSNEERERAARFHFSLHRARYIAGRGVLRALLGHYAGKAPEQIKLVTSAHGKPELASGELRFNVSHSQNFALLAFCLSHDIGVDIEAHRPDFDNQRIARIALRFFCEGEREELTTLESDEKRSAFFRCWTRKEALLKATGEGISGGLAKYQVSLLPEEAPGVLAPPDEAEEWSLFDLQPYASFAGALAVREVDIKVCCYEL